MTLDEIKALIDAMGASDLVEMEVRKDGWTLRLVRHGGSAAVPSPTGNARPAQIAAQARPVPVDNLQASVTKIAAFTNDVRAPLSGIVYLGPSPEAPPFVTVGQTVKAGSILCTIEAMKMFNSVTAERDGVIEAILVTTGAEVIAGQSLLRIA
jgi:acetyl-CoA carboxylase biotin carboxyl carrier protein